MEVFSTLVFRCIPLLFLVLAGIFARRRLGLDRESIAKLVIYLIAPLVMFTNVSQLDLKAEFIVVPFGFLILSCLVCFLFLKITRPFFKDPLPNLIAFSSGNANTGYFGLPVAIAIFGSEVTGLYLLFILGFLLFENTYGFYVLARGNFTAREAFQRLLRLPAVYAFAGAVLVNVLGLKMTPALLDFSASFRGAYTVLGMMIVGMGVAEVKSWKVDWKFIGTLFFSKFVVYPILAAAFIALDQSTLHVFDQRSHQMMLLIACCPLAANTVAFSVMLKTEPEKAALSVLMSTIFAVFYIPAMVALLFH